MTTYRTLPAGIGSYGHRPAFSLGDVSEMTIEEIEKHFEDMGSVVALAVTADGLVTVDGSVVAVPIEAASTTPAMPSIDIRTYDSPAAALSALRDTAEYAAMRAAHDRWDDMTAGPERDLVGARADRHYYPIILCRDTLTWLSDQHLGMESYDRVYMETMQQYLATRLSNEEARCEEALGL